MAITRFHGDRQIEDGTIDKDDLNTSLKNEIDAKVVGPASSTDNAIARFDGTTGKLVQNSGSSIDDSGNLLVSNSISANTLNATSATLDNLSVEVGSPDSGVATINTIKTNTINERTAGSGVTIDSVLLKDGNVDGRDISADGSRLDTITDANYLNSNTTKTQVGLANVTNDAQLKIASNLSDVANATTARSNLSVESTTQLNTRDTNNRARANHTGTQPMSTISDAGELATQDDTDILAKVYPVGSIYIATVATNPATLFGFGTWAAYGEGRVIVGKAGSGTFGTAGATGGAETHILTEAEMPNHNHNFNTRSGTGTNTNTAAQANGWGTDAASTNSRGSGHAHNNLQPYIVTYMWQRTA